MFKKFKRFYGFPNDGRVIVNMCEGKILSFRKLRDSEHIATIKEFAEIARAAGIFVDVRAQSKYN